MQDFDATEVETYIEIRGVYDGWSVAKLKDGTWVNRWEPGDRRYIATQKWIELQIAANDENP